MQWLRLQEQSLKKFADDIASSLRFFSCLPIPVRLTGSDDPESTKVPKLNETVIILPITGLIIALIPAMLWYMSSHLFSSFLAASIAIASGVLITGAMHEDGLADCVDGLGGGATKERALEIMRDSAIGTYGVAALFFSFALRILALASLSAWNGVTALLIAHSAARAFMVIAIYAADYIHQTGMGDAVRGGVDQNRFRITLGIAFICSLMMAFVGGGLNGLMAPLAGMFSAWSLLQWLKFRLGGYTGDGLGAMEQIAEITILIVLAALWS